MQEERHPDPAVHRAQRVLLMVHELHKLGYQKLRIAPGMSPSGCSWRCSITHVGNILPSHGAMLSNWDEDVAPYTSGQQNAYFGWEDAAQDTARGAPLGSPEPWSASSRKTLREKPSLSTTWPLRPLGLRPTVAPGQRVKGGMVEVAGL